MSILLPLSDDAVRDVAPALRSESVADGCEPNSSDAHLQTEYRTLSISEGVMNSPSGKLHSVSGIVARVEHLGYATSRHISAIVEQEKASMDKSKDQDRGKGAMEQDQQNQGGNTSMQGQLGHRDEDAELKDADADLGG
jgi:hypothetical protein